MKPFALLVSAIAAVAAQNVGGPPCAQPCFLTAISDTSCGLEPACLCKDTTFLTAVSGCIKKNCESNDQGTALAYGEGICKAASVTVTATSAGSASTGAASNSTTLPTATGSPAPIKTGGAARAMEVGGGIVGGLLLLMVL